MRGGRELRGVLFDLDGTLLDTALDMAAALNRLRGSEGLPALPFEQVRPLVSHGAPRLLKLAFGEPESARYDDLRKRFLGYYRQSLAVHTRLFTGFDLVLERTESAGLAWGVLRWPAPPRTVASARSISVPTSTDCLRAGSSRSTIMRSPTAPGTSRDGGHFNPGGKPHGRHDAPERHAGDLPNLSANGEGVAVYAATSDLLTVAPGPYSVVNRAIIIHESPDDYRSPPAGNSGARIACGVIRSMD